MYLTFLHLPVCVTQHSGMTPMPANYPLYGGPPYEARTEPGHMHHTRPEKLFSAHQNVGADTDERLHPTAYGVPKDPTNTSIENPTQQPGRETISICSAYFVRSRILGCAEKKEYR